MRHKIVFRTDFKARLREKLLLNCFFSSVVISEGNRYARRSIASNSYGAEKFVAAAVDAPRRILFAS